MLMCVFYPSFHNSCINWLHNGCKGVFVVKAQVEVSMYPKYMPITLAMSHQAASQAAMLCVEMILESAGEQWGREHISEY